MNNYLLISLDQAPPRIFTLKSSTRFYYVLSQNLGQYKPTSRDGNSKGGPTWRHVTCLNACKLRKLYKKEDHLLKILNGQKPTVPVLVGRKREKHPPFHTTPSRDALEITR